MTSTTTIERHPLMLPPAVEKLRTDRNFARAALPAQPMPTEGAGSQQVEEVTTR
jgi:hypothetical protein